MTEMNVLAKLARMGFKVDGSEDRGAGRPRPSRGFAPAVDGMERRISLSVAGGLATLCDDANGNRFRDGRGC